MVSEYYRATVMGLGSYNVHFETVLLVENALCLPLIAHLTIVHLVRLTAIASSGTSTLLTGKEFYTIQGSTFRDAVLQLPHGIRDDLGR